LPPRLKAPVRSRRNSFAHPANPNYLPCMTTPLAWTLGGPEIAIIFVLVLLLFGAKKIPELARGLGKSMGEFKRARDEFEDEIRRAEEDLDDDKEVAESTESTESTGTTEPTGKEEHSKVS